MYSDFFKYMYNIKDVLLPHTANMIRLLMSNSIWHMNFYWITKTLIRLSEKFTCSDDTSLPIHLYYYSFGFLFVGSMWIFAHHLRVWYNPIYVGVSNTTIRVATGNEILYRTFRILSPYFFSWHLDFALFIASTYLSF